MSAPSLQQVELLISLRANARVARMALTGYNLPDVNLPPPVKNAAAEALDALDMVDQAITFQLDVADAILAK